MATHTTAKLNKTIHPPGATLGMLGGGQLGRMFAIAARRFGYQVQVFGDPADSPAGQVCDRAWGTGFDDFDQLRQFADRVDVVSYEQENIPVATVEFLQQYVPVHPGVELLRAAQHRILEKSTLQKIGIATADFAPIYSLDDLSTAISKFGGRGILKTATLGYDGKGQVRLNADSDLQQAWNSLNVSEAILEREIDFLLEISIVAARFQDGSVTCFQPSVNHHVNHILDVSLCPSDLISAQTATDAALIARSILEHFDTIGVLCVEFFVTTHGKLLVNEIAPRPHNSGHLTIDACGCCQFEQQVRAVCGMPSGDVTQIRPSAMINLLGDHLLHADDLRWQQVFAQPEVKVHMYGKAEARKGRKMGHLTVLADSSEKAAESAIAARNMLMGMQ